MYLRPIVLALITTMTCGLSMSAVQARGGFHGGNFGGFNRSGFGGDFRTQGSVSQSSDRFSGDNRSNFNSQSLQSVQNTRTQDLDSVQSNRQDMQQSRQDYGQQAQQSRQDYGQQSQQERTSEANTLQSNRFNEADSLQSSSQDYRTNRYNNYYNNGDYHPTWGNYYGYGTHPYYGAGALAGATAGAITGAAVAGSNNTGSTTINVNTSAPPTAVTTLPPGYTTVYANNIPYYYVNGSFYGTGAGGYALIQPPPGVMVPYLPQGCTSSSSGSTTFYQCGGITYQGFYRGGELVYVVAN